MLLIGGVLVGKDWVLASAILKISPLQIEECKITKV